MSEAELRLTCLARPALRVPKQSSLSAGDYLHRRQAGMVLPHYNHTPLWTISLMIVSAFGQSLQKTL